MLNVFPHFANRKAYETRILMCDLTVETDLTLSGNEYVIETCLFPFKAKRKKKILEQQVIHSQENGVREDMNLSQRSKRLVFGTSLVAQWLRIHLPMWGIRVQALVWEDPTCRGATKPVCHDY